MEMKEVLWAGIPDIVDMFTEDLGCYEGYADEDIHVVTVSHYEAVPSAYNSYDAIIDTHGVAAINERLYNILREAVENKCKTIVFPNGAPLTNDFFESLPDGIEILIWRTVSSPTLQWSTIDGFPQNVWETKTRGFSRVTGVDVWREDNATAVYTLKTTCLKLNHPNDDTPFFRRPAKGHEE